MFHRSLLVAHRGWWWPSPEKQNSLEAIEAAFQEGFGVEIDVRSSGEDMFLSHDVPDWDRVGGALMLWKPMLELASQFKALPMCINIKEPGTVFRIVNDVINAGLQDNTYLFDFELCGASPPPVSGVKCLKRVSDRPENPYLGSFAGSWLDQWDLEWVTKGVIQENKEFGPVFLVSPELHGRELDCKFLDEWKDADGLCTDFPHLIAQILEYRPELHPVNKWWGE